jgi:hypothetical protein
MRIKCVRIHPAIGIARLGNSRDGYFIGPEIPGRVPAVQHYRDATQRLKRQAARFHLFAFDEDDRLLGEITELTASNCKITWQVHVRNAKAAGRRFAGVLKPRAPFRNHAHRRRRELVLDPGAASITGTHQIAHLSCESFMGRRFPAPLRLGTLRTDDAGRLLVLGGHGQSGSLGGATLSGGDFANHDGWYDDVSDGSVTAEVTMKDGARLTALPAWVIVAPPKYAPGLESIVSLYDTLRQVAMDQGLEDDPFSHKGYKPSFREDIYPILRRAAAFKWVFARAAVGHDSQFSIARARADRVYRDHVFRQFRVPSGHPKQPGAGTGAMPYIWSDFYPEAVNGTLTRHQYKVMQAWRDGHFKDDWNRRRPAATRITPAGLDRAALEPCVGAAFYPGIECSFKMRDVFRYSEPFRLDHDSVAPGDVTQQMSLPWQTDFVDCSDGDKPFVWWPAQRPIDVIPVGSSGRTPTVRWARNFGTGKSDVGPKAMIRDWHKLGLVTRDGSRFVEYGRIAAKPRARKR